MAVEATSGSILRFVDYMGAYAHDSELCMRSSQNSYWRAYTCYANSKPSSIYDWEHIVSLFNFKFFCAEAKFSLGRARPNMTTSREDLDMYMRIFNKKKTMDCCHLVVEEVLVNFSTMVCWKNTIFCLENLHFLTFAKLVKAPLRIKESFHRTWSPTQKLSLIPALWFDQRWRRD